MKRVNIGIVGGGLMGREVAGAFARWCCLEGLSSQPVLFGVCDLNPAALGWFERIPSVQLRTSDIDELLHREEVDVVYVAVPHNLHEPLYRRVLESGKDLLAEKPFGIDLEAAGSICDAISQSGRFVRCSSEFPFFPGAQHAVELILQSDLGRILEAQFGFHHSSDLDPNKPANWKRKSETCGRIGVMGDLGMHVTHIPLRLGWSPRSVYAQLQKGFPTRPDGAGGRAECDTYDNAVLHTWVDHAEGGKFPLRLEMKRLAPGQTNTWFMQVLGTKGGVRYSTAEPKTLRTCRIDDGGQRWERRDLGFQTVFPTITGGIFEPGFPDVIQQMWAAFLEERAGALGSRFGCVTPEEALQSHKLFDAALQSHESGKALPVAEFQHRFG